MATATETPATVGEATDEPREGVTVPADGTEHELPADPDGQALFDRGAYQAPELRIDQVDGQEVDKIAIKFTGRVTLDRTDPQDVALFNRIRLGRDVELRVSGRGARVGTGYTTSKGGDLEAVVGEREIRIDTVYVLDAEEL